MADLIDPSKDYEEKIPYNVTGMGVRALDTISEHIKAGSPPPKVQAYIDLENETKNLYINKNKQVPMPIRMAISDMPVNSVDRLRTVKNLMYPNATGRLRDYVRYHGDGYNIIVADEEGDGWLEVDPEEISPGEVLKDTAEFIGQRAPYEATGAILGGLALTGAGVAATPALLGAAAIGELTAVGVDKINEIWGAIDTRSTSQKAMDSSFNIVTGLLPEFLTKGAKAGAGKFKDFVKDKMPPEMYEKFSKPIERVSEYIRARINNQAVQLGMADPSKGLDDEGLKLIRDAQENLKIFQDLGIEDVDIGTVYDTPFMKRLVAATASSAGGSNILDVWKNMGVGTEVALKKIVEQMTGKKDLDSVGVGKLLKHVKPLALTRAARNEEFGDFFKKLGITDDTLTSADDVIGLTLTAMDTFGSNSRIMDEALGKLITTTEKLMDEAKANLKTDQFEGVAKRSLDYIKQLIGSKTTKEGMEQGILAGIPKRELNQLYGVINDIEEKMVFKRGGQKAVDELLKLRGKYTEFQDEFVPFLEKLVKAKEPGKILNDLASSTKFGTKHLEILKKSVGPETYNQILAGIFINMGRAPIKGVATGITSKKTAEGLTDFAQDMFSPEKFADEFLKIHPKARKMMLNDIDPTLAPTLTKFLKVIDMQAKTAKFNRSPSRGLVGVMSKFLNFSGKAASVAGLLTGGATTAASYGLQKKLAGGLSDPKKYGEALEMAETYKRQSLLLEPRFVRIYTDMLTKINDMDPKKRAGFIADQFAKLTLFGSRNRKYENAITDLKSEFDRGFDEETGNFKIDYRLDPGVFIRSSADAF